MAQLVERLIPTPEARGSNPVIGKKILNIYCQLYSKVENKEKETGNGPFKKTFLINKWTNLIRFCRIFQSADL